jgi:DNA repair exonuclease SbcCD ATPase subunit
LTKCPKCGAKVDAPVKTWSVSRKTSKSGGTEIVFGIFECPECGNTFRTSVKGKEKEELSIKGVAEKIKGIEGELVNTLKNLREKLKTLETERSNLLLEIDELKKMAEAKANALESEIGMLREEVKSLKQLLGVGEID